MNARNVAALRGLLLQHLDNEGFGGADHPFFSMLAERLTASGVLVPSALTPEDVLHIDDEAIWEGRNRRPELDLNLTIKALETIAKGEA